MSDKRRGYVRRGDATYPVELDDDALLAGDTGDTALDATEVAIGDDDMVAILEVAQGAIDEENVVAVDARQADEVVHLLIGDDERWVLALGIGAEVVVVVAKVGVARCSEHRVYLFLGGMGKKQIGDKRFTHPLFLAVHLLLSIMHGKVSVNAQLFQPVLSGLFVMVSHTQNEPLLYLLLLSCVTWFLWSVLHRHPILELTGERARGKPRTGKEIAAFSDVHIRQRVHRLSFRHMKKAWNFRHSSHTLRLWIAYYRLNE